MIARAATREPRRIRALRATIASFALLPLLPRLLHSTPALAALAAPFDAWFRLQCQRDAARTLRLFGQALPVCARCFGIYSGFGLGGLLASPELRASRLRSWLLLASASMLLDIVSEAWNLRPALASLRFSTGFFLAYPVGVALALSLRDRTRARAKVESRSPSSAPSTSD